MTYRVMPHLAGTSLDWRFSVDIEPMLAEWAEAPDRAAGEKRDEAAAIIQRIYAARTEKLDLKGLNLTSLPVEALKELPWLTEMILAQNQFTRIRPGFFNIFRLTYIDLSDNPLAEADVALFSGCIYLTEVNLCNTRLSEIPPALLSWSGRMVTLRISRTAISVFADELFRAPLIQIDLSGNRLERLPPAVCGLNRLTKLDLSGNALSDLPAELEAARALIRLDLSGNRFEKVPRVVQLLMNRLELLNIGGNPLQTAPSDLFYLRDKERPLTLYFDGTPFAANPREVMMFYASFEPFSPFDKIDQERISRRTATFVGMDRLFSQYNVPQAFKRGANEIFAIETLRSELEEFVNDFEPHIPPNQIRLLNRLLERLLLPSSLAIRMGIAFLYFHSHPTPHDYTPWLTFLAEQILKEVRALEYGDSMMIPCGISGIDPSGNRTTLYLVAQLRRSKSAPTFILLLINPYDDVAPADPSVNPRNDDPSVPAFTIPRESLNLEYLIRILRFRLSHSADHTVEALLAALKTSAYQWELARRPNHQHGKTGAFEAYRMCLDLILPEQLRLPFQYFCMCRAHETLKEFWNMPRDVRREIGFRSKDWDWVQAQADVALRAFQRLYKNRIARTPPGSPERSMYRTLNPVSPSH